MECEECSEAIDLLSVCTGGGLGGGVPGATVRWGWGSRGGGAQGVWGERLTIYIYQFLPKKIIYQQDCIPKKIISKKKIFLATKIILIKNN